jgi:hypothetical protein
MAKPGDDSRRRADHGRNAFGEALIVDIQRAGCRRRASTTCSSPTIRSWRGARSSRCWTRLGVKHKHATNGPGSMDVACRPSLPTPSRRARACATNWTPDPGGCRNAGNGRLRADQEHQGVMHVSTGIPVVMHSSLSSEANHAMGKSVGVDAYVAQVRRGSAGRYLAPAARTLIWKSRKRLANLLSPRAGERPGKRETVMTFMICGASKCQ